LPTMVVAKWNFRSYSSGWRCPYFCRPSSDPGYFFRGALTWGHSESGQDIATCPTRPRPASSSGPRYFRTMALGWRFPNVARISAYCLLREFLSECFGVCGGVAFQWIKSGHFDDWEEQICATKMIEVIYRKVVMSWIGWLKLQLLSTCCRMEWQRYVFRLCHNETFAIVHIHVQLCSSWADECRRDSW
jgi:hypothetical protein